MVYIRNAIVWMISFLMVLPPQWVLAAEPIVVDTSAAAAHQASLATAPSGKAIVNIVKPNAAGVSHNKFTDFNVTTAGIVLNNATALSTTNLVGVIEANPNFAGTAASLILNEVTSSNRSILNGATEIGGQAADYILANPNGITCDGCGFINTPRATLSTGTPTFTGSAFTGLSVNAGDVVIAGLGLDASKVDKFDIITRATTINAQINAKDLGIHTGRQDFDYAARSGTAKADDGSTKPTFAIDSTALGGMYAGRITLVGTEAGLGVRVAGDMAASTGDMIITADGKLELKSDLSAKTDLQVASTSSDIVADKTVYAAGTIKATANGGTITANAGASYGAAGDVTLKAANITTGVGGQFVAGMDGGGALTTNGTLDVQATTQISTGDGFLGGGSAVVLKAPTIDLSRATDDGSETVRSRGTLRMETTNATASNGRIASDGAMTLAGNPALTLGAGRYTSATSIAMTGNSISSAATLVSDGVLSATSNTGNITNTGSMTAGTTATLNSATGITNSGTIESQTGTIITAAGTLSNTSGAKIKSAQNTTVTTAGLLVNAGSIYAVNAATLTAPTITNSGSIAGGTDLLINVAAFTNDAGVLHAQNNLTVGGYDGAAWSTLFDNASGVVETVAGDIVISADTITNRKKIFSYTSGLNNARVSKTLVTNPEAPLVGAHGESGTTEWPLWRNHKLVTPVGTYIFQVPGRSSPHWQGFYYYEGYVTADSASGLVSSGKDIILSASTVANDKSTVSAAGDIHITVDTFNNQATDLYKELYVQGNATCYGGADVGEIGSYCASYQPLHLINRQQAYTADSLIQAGGALNITASGGVRNGTEKIYATPPAYTQAINSSALTTTPTPSALLNTTQYVDLIPGRDALFVASAAPNPKFLFETRAEFINVQNYYGSDYFINAIGGITPGTITARLGDAYFDTTLVREAVMRETGKRWLGNTVQDDIQQMKVLIDNGVAASGGLNLAFGISLSADQINALTSDIVWYVEEQYQGRTVLVPKVYLASTTRATLDDRGAILAGDNVTITADTIDNDKSVIKAKNDVTLTANGDIISKSAKIKAGNDITLTSTDGSVAIETQVDQFNVKNHAGIQSNILSVQHERSNVTAGGKLTIAANDNISIRGADVAAGGGSTLTANGDITLGAQQVRNDLNFYNGYYNRTTNIGSTFKSGGQVDISSGANAKIQGSTLIADGDINIAAVNDVAIESTADVMDYMAALKRYTAKSSSTTNTASTVQSGANLTITSGGNARVKASRLSAANDLNLQATGDVVIESAADSTNTDHRKYKKKTITQQSAELSAGGDVNVGTLVGDMSIIASKVDGRGNVTLNTPNGTLYLGARKDYFEEHISETKNGMFISTYINRGRADETVIPTLLTAKGNLAIVTADGVIADYKDTGNLTDSIAQLSQAPGLAWMGDLQARSDVTWNAVQEAHRSWDYRSQGISPTGAALISLAVAWTAGPAGFVDGGMGADLFGSKLVGTFGMEATTANVIANAGFTSLLTQAATAIVGNGGDLGAALKQLGSSATLKALATSMVTAGLIEGLSPDLGGLNASADQLTAMTEPARKMAEFSNTLKTAIAEGVISSTVDSVINGVPLSENLKNGLISAAVQVVGAEAAKAIGKATTTNDLTRYIAHAALGCASGAALGGECASGAGGAVVGELVASVYFSDDQRANFEQELGTAIDTNQISTAEAARLVSRWSDQGVNLSRLVAGLSVGIAGGDVGIAAATANTAVENNICGTGACAAIVMAVMAGLELIDKGLMAKDAFDLAEAIESGDDDRAADLASDLAIESGVEITIGHIVPGSLLATKFINSLRKKGIDKTVVETVEQFLTKNASGDTLDYEITAIHKLGDANAGIVNTSRIRSVNSRVPINSKSYAGTTMELPGGLGQKYPHGVPFSGAGYPDFSRYSQANVRIKLTGNRTSDFREANKAMGYPDTPENMTWHHHQDAGYMQLVPFDLHKEVKHTGGIATSSQ